MTKTTITINGRTYDAITGRPIAHSPAQPASRQADTQPVPRAAKPMRAFSDFGPSTPVTQLKKPERPAYGADLTPIHTERPAQSIHQHPQRSQTLYRKALQKPVIQVESKPAQQTRSPFISKFGAQKAPQTGAAEPKQQQANEDAIKPAQIHPTVAKVVQQRSAAHAEAHKQQPSGKQLKEMLIKERLAEVGNEPAKKERAHALGKKPRLITILSSTLALLVLGGYLTYITLPSISLRVAASRAGINATMPEYKPDGYSLDGPIAYSPGEVIIRYKSNTNDSGFKLTQKATNWDSQAVLDNYVSPQASNYLSFQDRGITVYTFGNKAAWVNGGVLYTLDGNAALSSTQILHVATSM